MQKYKQAAISIAILTVILSAGLYTSYRLNSRNKIDQETPSKEEKILVAFENRDYHSWKAIVLQHNQTYAKLSQNDFNTFLEARQAARSGNYDRAIAISQQLKFQIRNKIPQVNIG